MTTPIGDNLRRLRTARGETQTALATRTGVSVDLIKKLEQGRREGARLTTLTKLADALGVGLSELTGKRPSLDGPGDRLVLGLRDALINPAHLPPLGGTPGDEPPAPTQLVQGAVDAAWRLYWRGQFADLARTLPTLLAEARTSGGQPLAETYQLAACLSVHLAQDHLASLAAERAITAAATTGDQLLDATLRGTYAWVLAAQGRPRDAATYATSVAEQIEPRLGHATPQQVTVWGGLLITAMAPAAATGDTATVDELAQLINVGAAHLPADERHYQVAFGPVQAAVQVTHARVTLHQPGRALTAATHIPQRALRPVEYGRHLLDIAAAQAQTRHTERAVATLQRARGISPTWFRHQGVARYLVADLVERQQRLSSGLRDLAQSLDVH